MFHPFLFGFCTHLLDVYFLIAILLYLLLVLLFYLKLLP
nr:MAG TPA: hypothetical protein [Caudoviricetes sp.]